ncbi:MAG TPA: translocation/assembly module TamB domain-containing protein, partial [Longimicrobiales bacterium]|nr:translocation/assembly module TamB domain-containing protein [Longimicrobiales bacterium]
RNVRVSGFEGEARALVEPPFRDLVGLTSATARLELDRIALPDADLGNVTVSLEGGPESFTLEASALVDENRRGEMNARIDPTLDARSMEIDRLDLQLDEDEWTLAGPAVLSFRDGFALRAFRLEAGDQVISFDGGVTEAGALDLSLDMDSTDIGTVADLLGYPRLDGWLGGRARLEGTTGAPVGNVELMAGYHEEGGSPTTVRLRLESDGRRAMTDVDLRDPDGGLLVVDGVVPLQDGEEVDLRVEAQAFPIASAIVFIDAEHITELEGRLDAQVAVSGSTDDIRFEGPLSLENGLARVPSLGVTWEGIRFTGRGDGAALRIDSGAASAGSGSMSFSGSIALDSVVALDLDVALDEFRAIQTHVYRATVSGDLHMGGHLNAPIVDGRLGVESLDVYIDERVSDGGLQDVVLDAADLETLRERFGYIVVEEDLEPARGELITADLVVELGRDSWIRSRSAPEMAVAFSGAVTVRLRPGEEPHVEGTLTTIPNRGYIAQFGKRFTPQDGTVTLDGPPASAEIDLSASYAVPSRENPDGAEAIILLGVTGTRDELALSLSSEPTMATADIVSYIATGRPAASTLALGDADAEADTGEPDGPSGGLAGAGAGLAVGQILSSIETAVQTGVGLDVVEIRRDGIRGATLAAGKYVSPRLYVGFAQPLMRRERDALSLVEQDRSEVEVEFLAVEGLLLNLEGSASALSLFLRGRLAY